MGWNCLGRIRSCGLIGEGASLRVGGFLKHMPFPVSLSLPVLVDQMQALSCCCSTDLPTCYHASCHDGNGLTLGSCKEAPTKCLLLQVASFVVSFHSIGTETKTPSLGLPVLSPCITVRTSHVHPLHHTGAPRGQGLAPPSSPSAQSCSG